MLLLLVVLSLELFESVYQDIAVTSIHHDLALLLSHRKLDHANQVPVLVLELYSQGFSLLPPAVKTALCEEILANLCNLASSLF